MGFKLAPRAGFEPRSTASQDQRRVPGKKKSR